VDFYSFAPIAAVLDAGYSVVTGLATFLTPLAGPASSALAIIVITLLVRTVLIPVGAAQMRAEFTRRRLAPRLSELQRRHQNNPALLQRKIAELYAAEKASPVAGCLPTLAQAPVLSTVYGLFVLTSVNGHANALLVAPLFGLPLGTSLAHFLGAGFGAGLGAGAIWPGAAVFLGLLLVIAVVAGLSRRIALAQAPASHPDSAERRDAASLATQQLAAALSWAPFITVLVAAWVPLAATLYLAVTTTWTLVERALLRRRFTRASTARAGDDA
jgi:YidC/Oxa1 family membrane protein insertase